jgi:predicted nucleic acid-binding protein
MRALDTNVLIYVHDPRDPVKQAKASALVASLTDGALLWQVACEFLAASRKLAAIGYNQKQAFQDLTALRQVWTMILPSSPVLDRSESLTDRFSLSFWDSMILAACLESGVQHFYSEDFDAYSNIDGLQISNPFT